jgi:predicted ATPase with chaperone activity
VPRVDYEKLASDRAGESSEAVRQRVLSARQRQLARLDGSGLTCNADMGPAHIREYCELDETSKALIRSAMNQLGMSARAFHRVLYRYGQLWQRDARPRRRSGRLPVVDFWLFIQLPFWKWLVYF